MYKHQPFSRSALRRFFALALSMILIALLAVVVPAGMNPFKAEAEAQQADKPFVPRDQIEVKVLADGTHNGPGTETFIRTENGFPIADNAVDDGVVASGDVVTYQVNINIAAGPERTLNADFVNKSTWLDATDFSRLTLLSPIIKTKWNTQRNGMDITVPHGATGTLSGTVTVRAKDTKGTPQAGNIVVGELYNNGNLVFSSKSKEITVVSTPFADLTVDSDGWSSGSYNQDSEMGYFTISPKPLQMEGYSAHGLSAAGSWVTDIDVSSFPADTIWSTDYFRSEFHAWDGILYGISGEGELTLYYKLPKDKLPKTLNQVDVYTMHLNVNNEESFGGNNIIKDPGNDQPGGYRTSQTTLNGKKVGALDGNLMPNNNYSKATWIFETPPDEDIWRYDVAAPFMEGKTYFEKPNVYWDATRPFYEQGKDYPQREVATSDNDLYNRLTVLSYNMSELSSADNVTMTDALDTESDDNYRMHDYDTTKNVVVTVWNRPIDPLKYKVEFEVDGEWIESDRPIAGSKKSRITFNKDAFGVALDGGRVIAYWPVKARSDYDKLNDIGKVLNSVGRVDFDTSNTPGVVYTSKYDNWVRNVPLTFMQEPVVSTTLLPEGVPVNNNRGGFDTSWVMSDSVLKAPVSSGYSATRTIVLDTIYDPKTFLLEPNSLWKVDKIDGQTIMLKRDNIVLTSDNAGGWKMEDVHFKVSSLINPSTVTGEPIVANVSEEISLQWSGIAGLTDGSSRSTSTASQSFDAMNEMSQYLYAIDKKREIEDELTWEAIVNVGRLTTAGTTWNQEIVLPYNGDDEKIAQLNDTNGSNIRLDHWSGYSNEMQGVGRSRFDGTYDVSTVIVSDAPKNVQVVFLSADGAVLATKTVKDDGAVDLSGFDTSAVRTISLAGVDNTSNQQSAGLKVRVGITPHDNNVGNDYVMWVNPITSPELPEQKAIMAWPAHIEVVMGSISGRLWRDDNKNSVMDEYRYLYADVLVALEKKDAQGNWVQVPDRAERTYVIRTDDGGYYYFDGLHSGDYRVKLVNVDKTRTDTMELDRVSGATGVDAADGDLHHAIINRFNVERPTELTRSYTKAFNDTSDAADVSLGVGARLDDVNFGFFSEMADIVLDKSPARLTTGENTSTAQWDVSVKNTGNTTISGATISDRMSNEVLGVGVDLGYNAPNNWNMDGGSEYITGDFKKFIGNDRNNNAIVTSDGVWVRYSLYGPRWWSEYPQYSGYYHITGMTGDFIDAYMAGPIDYNERDYKYDNMGALTIQTTDGFWSVLYTNFRQQIDTPVPIVTVNKIDGITGDKVGFAGNVPTYQNNHVAIATTDGVWRYNQEGLVKMYGFTGTPLAISSINDSRDQLRSYILVTTDGVWADGGTDKFSYIGSLPDPVIALYGGGTSVVAQTASGLWDIGTQYTYNDNYKILNQITGYTGDITHVSNKMGIVLSTTDGVWIKSNTSVYENNRAIRKVPEITDKVLDIQGGASGYVVITDKGIEIGSYNEPAHYDGPRYSSGDLGTVLGVNEVDIVTTGKQWGSGYSAWTTTGVWINEGGGNGQNLYQYLGVSSVHHDEANIAQQGSTVVETNSQGREFARRSYVVPDIEPGKEIVLRFTGTVRNRDVDLVVGNQAWVTSAQTPREGITAYTKNEVLTTGDKQQPGVPDLPVLPDPDKVKLDGIYGTQTVKLNSHIGEEMLGGPDDLADQTPVLIKGDGSAKPLDASISGVAWYDINRDNNRDDNEPRARDIYVEARDKDGVLVGEARTNDRGEWTITGLADGDIVSVQYYINGHKHDDKVWSAVIAGGSDTNTDSDIDAVGFVVRGDAVVARTGGSSGMADAGLQVVDAALAVVKGGHVGDEAAIIRGDQALEPWVRYINNEIPQPSVSSVDSISGGFDDDDSDPRTAAFVYSFTNKGNTDLVDIEVGDVTAAGNEAYFSKYLHYTGDNERYVFESAGGNKNRVVNAETGKPLVMKPGESINSNFQIWFTIGNERHEDTVTVTGIALDEQGNRVGIVEESDVFSARYEIVPPKQITLRKVDIVGQNTAKEKTLSGMNFVVEKTSYADLTSVKANDDSAITGQVGSFYVGKSGDVSFDLTPGVYRITETKSPKSYLLPDSTKVSHFVRVYYDEHGASKVDTKTINNFEPGADNWAVALNVENAATDATWGTIELGNDPGTRVDVGFRLPETGLAQLALLGAAGLGLLAGFFIYSRQANKRNRRDELN